MPGIDRDRELLFEELPLTFPCVVQAGKIPEATFSNRSVYIYIYAPIFVAKRTFFMERWQTIRGRNKNGTQRDRYRAC